ncbi:MAG: polyhydroxyalkanoate synthesis repressor PhaR [Gammaproteobacteria bacterium RIFCSPHIGHO2_12_FULL_41_20]|nr:MAG: polyhydroxyalkanoate synthesis repressor PhaR [Gammaproteobacteria bacterium RIFCSPHIGHO2_12_FULL_41_20]
MRIIKKYPNRRLYDTDTSRYITLDDIKQLILKHLDFKVVDVRTEEDMTNYVLLQIISEEECAGKPIFTTEILLNIIRFYGNPLQQTMSQFLEKNLALFTDHQADFHTYLQDMLGKHDAFSPMSEWMQKNMAMWQSVFSPPVAKTTKQKSTKTTKQK